MIHIPPPELIDLFKTTPGAISLHEFFAISWLASQAPIDGVCFDLGANAGKAAIAEAIGLSRNRGMAGTTLLCVDTVFDLKNDVAWTQNFMQPDRMTTGWTWIYDPDFHEKAKGRIEQASGGAVEAQLIGDSTLFAIPKLGKPGVAWAFCDVDNANKMIVDGTVDALAPKMVSGGIICHHDFGSQFFFPGEAQDRLIETGDFERIEIPWEEIKIAVDSIGGDHGTNDTWHHRETPRPMFVGAIRRV